ncbi:uncharacterized protein LOC142572777 [Dermacentor variabilis]|uniref:uncharacterized protein LOC142572777 n=1 Tax=Dermacentor variabilis TaxID=34621 RepID=UPI003F5C8EF3
MAANTKAAFSVIYMLALALTNVRAEGKHQLERGIVDAFQLFRTFPYAVAVYDVDNDGDLDCLTTVRTNFMEEPLSATYVFILKGLGGNESRNITYHIKPGPTPDMVFYTVDDDYDFVQVGHFIYSDYKSCAVVGFPFGGRQECILWTTKDVLNDVPEHCMDQYKDICGDAVNLYDEESCAAFAP